MSIVKIWQIFWKHSISKRLSTNPTTEVDIYIAMIREIEDVKVKKIQMFRIDHFELWETLPILSPPW